jgi:hypothetical protein
VIAWDYKETCVLPLYCGEGQADAGCRAVWNFMILYFPNLSDDEIYLWLTRRTISELREAFAELPLASLN